MKALEYIKITIKNLLSNFQVSIVYFIGLPLIIGAVMGFMNDTLHGARELEIDPVKIILEDKDYSSYSRQLVSFIESKEIQSTIEVIVDESDAEAIVKIPKGYGVSLEKSEKNKIIIKENDTPPVKLQIVKDILDSYHIQLLKAKDSENINDNFEVISRAEKQRDNPYAFYSVSMINFVVGVLILSMVNFAIDKKLKGINRRIYSTPSTRSSILNMKILANLIYVFVTIFIYCLAYRATGVAFTGNILLLMVIILISSIIITSIIAFIVTVFSEKYAKVASMIIFILPIIGGGAFFEGENILADFSITKYICELFKVFERTGAINSKLNIVIIIMAISAVLYGVALIVERKRGGKNETSMANMG